MNVICMRVILSPQKKQASLLTGPINDKFSNFVKNKVKQGDDSYSVFTTDIKPLVMHFFANIHNDLQVKLKPEIGRLLSDHNENPLGFMTNHAGDFLKSSAIFDLDSGKILFSRPYQTFLLRAITPNNVPTTPERILQVARSFALSACFNNMAVLHARELFETTMDYLREQKMVRSSMVEKDLFLNGEVEDLATEVPIEITEEDVNKWHIKHIDDGDSVAFDDVMTFPSQNEIDSYGKEDFNLLYRLQINDMFYAKYRLPQLMVDAFTGFRYTTCKFTK